MENKGVTHILLNENEQNITIKINEKTITCRLDLEFESTIKNIRKSLDDNLHSIKIKEEIIYNISKFSHQFFTLKNNDVTGTISTKNKSDDLSKKISFEQWQTTLLSKYLELKNKVFELMPELWKPLEFALSVKSILNIKDCTLPFIGIILGPPSSVKTLCIELFRDCDHIFYTDNFSPKAFVSHNTSVAREKLSNIDLLPKIKNNCFLTPELSPTFSKRYEELVEILGIITRLADGHGYESDTGAQGHRGYSGEHMFTWIGAAVDVPQKVHKLLGTLGPKLYFMRLNNREDVNEEFYLEKIRNTEKFIENFDQIKLVLHDYIQWFNGCPTITTNNKDAQTEDTDSGEPLDHDALVKITWDSSKDSEEGLRCIIKLAKLLSRFRGVIPTWETRDTQGSDYAYTFATIEEPDRAITQLKNLARGHALSQGRNYITMEDMPLIVNVVLSTASRERVKIFDHLLKNNGQTDTIRISEELLTTKPTALKTMTELTALGIVDKIELGGDVQGYYNHSQDDFPLLNSTKSSSLIQIQLKAEFMWFLSDEFKKLRRCEDNEKGHKDDFVYHKKQNTLELDTYFTKRNEEKQMRKENCTPSINNSSEFTKVLENCEIYPITLYIGDDYFPIVPVQNNE